MTQTVRAFKWILAAVVAAFGVGALPPGEAAYGNTVLSGVMPADGDVSFLRPPQFSADGRIVVYLADALTDNVTELFAAPVTGEAAPWRLNGPVPPNLYVDTFRLTPDGNYVVFSTAVLDFFIGGEIGLYQVPVEGGTSLRLDTTPGHALVGGFEISPDGGQVVYYSGQGLSSVPVTGGTATALAKPEGDLSFAGFYIAPDSGRVVYALQQVASGMLYPYALYSVPLTGGAPITLTQPMAGGVSMIMSVQITPDSQRVVYTAPQDSAGVIELYSVSITGTAGLRLNAPLADGTSVYQYNIRVSPDGQQVAYVARHQADSTFHLYLTSTAVSQPTPIAEVPMGGFMSLLVFSPDNARLVCTACRAVGGPIGLYSAPTTGGALTQLHATHVDGNAIALIQVSPDSSRGVYKTGRHLYSVPLDGGISITLTAPLPWGGSALFDDFRITPDSQRVVYRGDQRSAELIEVYSVALDGSARAILNGTPLNNTDVAGFRISPDGRRVVYGADQNRDDVLELFVIVDQAKIYLPLLSR